MCCSYEKLVRNATKMAVMLAILLICLKLFTWWITDSISLLASLLDSSMDLLASSLNFFLVRYALKPADSGHRFGHGKAESLAALAQSGFIIGSAAFLLLNSFKLLINPTPVNQPILGIIVSSISIVVTATLVLYQRHVVKLTNSTAIKADMLHYSSDLVLNIAVIAAFLLGLFGFIYADAIFALLIGCYIFYNALKIANEAIQDLLDKALPESDNQKILDIAASFIEVEGIHDLKTRRSGPITFVQLHIELDDDIPLIKAHAIADQIEILISQQFAPAEVIIHQDPISVVPTEITRFRKKYR